MTMLDAPEKVSINPRELLGLVVEAQYHIRQTTRRDPVPSPGLERALSLLNTAANLLGIMES